MIITILKRLSDDGTLRKLTRAKLISTKIFMYQEIYLDYKKNVDVMKMRRNEATEKTAITMRVSRHTVLRARKLMESEA